MNTRSGSSRLASSNLKSGNEIVRYPFRTMLTQSNETTNLSVVAFDLSPTSLFSSGRIATEMTNWESWRCTKLRARSLNSFGGISVAPGSTYAAGVLHGVAFSSLPIFDTAGIAFSWETLAQLDGFSVANGYQPAILKLNTRQLVGERPLKWWRTTGRSAPPLDLFSMGALYIFNDNDTSYANAPLQLVTVEGVVEFTGRLPASEQVAVALQPARVYTSPHVRDIILTDHDDVKESVSTTGSSTHTLA